MKISKKVFLDVYTVKGNSKNEVEFFFNRNFTHITTYKVAFGKRVSESTTTYPTIKLIKRLRSTIEYYDRVCRKKIDVKKLYDHNKGEKYGE